MWGFKKSQVLPVNGKLSENERFWRSAFQHDGEHWPCFENSWPRSSLSEDQARALHGPGNQNQWLWCWAWACVNGEVEVLKEAWRNEEIPPEWKDPDAWHLTKNNHWRWMQIKKIHEESLKNKKISEEKRSEAGFREGGVQGCVEMKEEGALLIIRMAKIIRRGIHSMSAWINKRFKNLRKKGKDCKDKSAIQGWPWNEYEGLNQKQGHAALPKIQAHRKWLRSHMKAQEQWSQGDPWVDPFPVFENPQEAKAHWGQWQWARPAKDEIDVKAPDEIFLMNFRLFDEFFVSPLTLAIEFGHQDVIEFLLNLKDQGRSEGGLCQGEKSKKIRRNPKNERDEKEEDLKTMEVDLHQQNDWPLRMACFYGEREMVTKLVAHGADVHAQNDEPLRCAMMAWNDDIVTWLLMDHQMEVSPALERWIDHWQNNIRAKNGGPDFGGVWSAWKEKRVLTLCLNEEKETPGHSTESETTGSKAAKVKRL